jgi:hypothetical protein
LVKFSAIGAHPPASFTFGRQHGQSERLIMDSGVAFTFVQPNFYMQNLLWSADTIKARGEFYGTLGATPASHVDARDIARVVAAALTEPIDRHAERVHLVTGPAALTFAQMAETFSSVLGQSVRYVDLTDEQLKAGLLASGQPNWQATALVELNTYARQGLASVARILRSVSAGDQPEPWSSGRRITHRHFASAIERRPGDQWPLPAAARPENEPFMRRFASIAWLGSGGARSCGAYAYVRDQRC